MAVKPANKKNVKAANNKSANKPLNVKGNKAKPVAKKVVEIKKKAPVAPKSKPSAPVKSKVKGKTAPAKIQPKIVAKEKNDKKVVSKASKPAVKAAPAKQVTKGKVVKLDKQIKNSKQPQLKFEVKSSTKNTKQLPLKAKHPAKIETPVVKNQKGQKATQVSQPAKIGKTASQPQVKGAKSEVKGVAKPSVKTVETKQADNTKDKNQKASKQKVAVVETKPVVEQPVQEDSGPKKRGRKSKAEKEGAGASSEAAPKNRFDQGLSPEELELLEEERKEKEKNQVKRYSEDDIKDSLLAEVLALTEDFSLDDVFSTIRSIDFFRAETGDCLEKGCDNPDTTSGYCRYHYIKNWSDIKKKQAILESGKLVDLIRDLTDKFPMANLEMILSDLVDEKSFFKVLKELNVESVEDNFDEYSDDQSEDDDQDIAYETRDSFDLKDEIE